MPPGRYHLIILTVLKESGENFPEIHMMKRVAGMQAVGTRLPLGRGTVIIC